MAKHCAFCKDECLNALTVGHQGGYGEWYDSRVTWYGPEGCAVPTFCEPSVEQRGHMYSCP